MNKTMGIYNDMVESMHDMFLEKYYRENLYATLNSIIAWAEERNLINGSTPKDQLAKLIQELGEVSEAICKEEDEALKLEIGDMIAILAIIAKMRNTSISECAFLAYEKIQHRKGIMLDGVFIKETDEGYENILRKLGNDKREDSIHSR